jgi:heme-degrading monooxygenase HmoA
MYGTVARMHVKAGSGDKLSQVARDFEQAHVPGFIASYAYQMDADPNEYLLAVIFDSKASYRANAESPAQNDRFHDMLALLEREPEWHDGEIVAVSKSAG